MHVHFLQNFTNYNKKMIEMDASWLVTAVLGVALIYCMYWLVTINSNYWQKRGVPSVKSVPVFGMMFELFFKNKGLSEIFNDIYKDLDGEKFGGYFQFITPVLMIRDPELINQIMIKDFTHFEDRGPALNSNDDLFTKSLASLTGDEWRTARHKMTVTFTSGKLKMMFDTIKQCSERVVAYLEERSAKDKDVDAKDMTFKFILNVVANIAFGLQIDMLDDKASAKSEFLNMSNRFFKPSIRLMVKFMLFLSAPKLLNKLGLKLTDNDVNTFFRKLTKDVVQHRLSTGTRRNDFLQLMLDQKNKEESATVDDDEKNNTLLQDAEDPEDKELLDQLKNTPAGKDKHCVFTDEFMAAQTFIFISGGSETTSSVLSFVLFELAANPHLQRRVQQEVDDAIASHLFTYQAVKKMTYMEQFINETFRMRPLGGALMRICTKDYEIPGTKVVIEQGTYVSIPIGGLHKDAQYFPNPQQFDPDRFSNMDDIPKGVFFSFGGGPRICIAMRLAMLQMKVFLAAILLNYTVVISKKTKVPLKMMKNSVMPMVEGGMWLQFEKRNRN